MLFHIFPSAADFTISRVMGIYCILKAMTLIQTTLYIHFKGTGLIYYENKHFADYGNN
jgi:hypothetical protein